MELPNTPPGVYDTLECLAAFRDASQPSTPLPLSRAHRNRGRILTPSAADHVLSPTLNPLSPLRLRNDTPSPSSHSRPTPVKSPGFRRRSPAPRMHRFPLAAEATFFDSSLAVEDYDLGTSPPPTSGTRNRTRVPAPPAGYLDRPLPPRGPTAQKRQPAGLTASAVSSPQPSSEPVPAAFGPSMPATLVAPESAASRTSRLATSYTSDSIASAASKHAAVDASKHLNARLAKSPASGPTTPSTVSMPKPRPTGAPKRVIPDAPKPAMTEASELSAVDALKPHVAGGFESPAAVAQEALATDAPQPSAASVPVSDALRSCTSGVPNSLAVTASEPLATGKRESAAKSMSQSCISGALNSSATAANKDPAIGALTISNADPPKSLAIEALEYTAESLPSASAPSPSSYFLLSGAVEASIPNAEKILVASVSQTSVPDKPENSAPHASRLLLSSVTESVASDVSDLRAPTASKSCAAGARYATTACNPKSFILSAAHSPDLGAPRTFQSDLPEPFISDASGSAALRTLKSNTSSTLEPLDANAPEVLSTGGSDSCVSNLPKSLVSDGFKGRVSDAMTVSPMRPPRSPLPPSLPAGISLQVPKSQRSIELNRTPPPRFAPNGLPLPLTPTMPDAFRSRSAHLSSPIFRDVVPALERGTRMSSPNVRVNPLADTSEEEGQLPTGVLPEIVGEVRFTVEFGFEESLHVDLGGRASRVPLPYAITVKVDGANEGSPPRLVRLEHHPDFRGSALVSILNGVALFEKTDVVEEDDEAGVDAETSGYYEDAVVTFWAAPDVFELHNCANLVLVVVDEDGKSYETSVDVVMTATAPQIAVESSSTGAQPERMGTQLIFSKDQNFAEETVTVWNETAENAPVLVNIVLDESEFGVFSIGTDSESTVRCIPRTIPAGSSYSFTVKFELRNDDRLRSSYFGTVLIKLGDIFPVYPQSMTDCDLHISYDHVLELQWNRASIRGAEVGDDREVLREAENELGELTIKQETGLDSKFSPVDVLLGIENFSPTEGDLKSNDQYYGAFSLLEPVRWELLADHEDPLPSNFEDPVQSSLLEQGSRCPSNAAVTQGASSSHAEKESGPLNTVEREDLFPDSGKTEATTQISVTSKSAYDGVSEKLMLSPHVQEERLVKLSKMSPREKLIGHKSKSGEANSPVGLQILSMRSPKQSRFDESLLPIFSNVREGRKALLPERMEDKHQGASSPSARVKDNVEVAVARIEKSEKDNDVRVDAVMDLRNSAVDSKHDVSRQDSDGASNSSSSSAAKSNVTSCGEALGTEEEEHGQDMNALQGGSTSESERLVISETPQCRAVESTSKEHLFEEQSGTAALSSDQHSLAAHVPITKFAENVVKTALVKERKFISNTVLETDIRPKLRLTKAVRKNGVNLLARCGSEAIAISNGTGVELEVWITPKAVKGYATCATVEPNFLVLGPDSRTSIIVTRSSGLHGKMKILLSCNIANERKHKVKYEVPLIVHPYLSTEPPNDFSLDRPTVTFYNPHGAARSCCVRVLNDSSKRVSYQAWITAGQERSGNPDDKSVFSLDSTSEGFAEPKSCVHVDVRFNGKGTVRHYYANLNIRMNDSSQCMKMFGYTGGSRMLFEFTDEKRVRIRNTGSRYGFVLLTGPDHQRDDQLATSVVLGKGDELVCELPYGSGSVVYTGDEIARARFQAALREAPRRDAHRKDLDKLFAGQFDGQERASLDENLDFRSETEFTLYYASRLLDSCTMQYGFDINTHQIIQNRAPTPTNGTRHGNEWTAFVDWEGAVHIVNSDTKRKLVFIADGAEPHAGTVPALGDAVLRPFREQVMISARGTSLDLTACSS